MSTGVMLFNPFTGMPRHPDDIRSDPDGFLLWDGEARLRAAQTFKWEPVPVRACIKPTHEAANAFLEYWNANGETHKHGYYESTWGAINKALAFGWDAPKDQPIQHHPV